MKKRFYLIFIFSFTIMHGQSHTDEYIKALVDQYADKPELKCEILVQVDVDGMHIPDKKITVTFEKDKNPKVKGEGLALLPKKGSIDQFSKLLSSPFQAIFLSDSDENLQYKLVSLDSKNDWITADITFDKKSFLIYESVVNTQKHGSFQALHSYDNEIYPSKSIITFDIKKFKIPLKFIGRERSISKYPKNDENVHGKITLWYTYLD